MTRFGKVKELFHLALEKEEAARADFVARATGGDARLREEVMALLRVHEGAERRSPQAEAGESAGDRLGPYRLLQPIGAGGFGVVWMAEQERPVRRKVALKIIKLGMDTKQVVARFEAERQALALMDHENIAKVFDAGATEQGRPYFVMELVKGVPITAYCDQAQLSTAGRLELFQRVCHAVQHAHTKGVIHRDLKPSNVLVSLHDGRPVPKVIDFGVAKATDRRLTERTLFTEFRQIIGTPEYMSPEQAEFSGLDVDTRSDIYSLGVLLYELLTGTKPFDMRALLEKGFDEMLRHIREVDPPKPSTRVSTLGEAGTGIAQHRATAPRLLGRTLRGDLDWICMKALEKERVRRYGTASDLAADIGRYLLDQPIEARPPSSSYRAVKFVRRHRAGVAAGAVAVVALAGGLVVATLGWREAGAQRDIAAASAREASTEATRARTVIAFLEGMLGAGDPHAAKGADYKVRELLDEFSGGLRGQLEDEPDVAATLHQILANAYAHLELLDKADEHQAVALDLRRRHLGETHPATLESMASRAWLIHDRANYAEAERALREVRGLYGHAALADPVPDILDYGIADMLLHQGRDSEAQRFANACVERRRARGASPGDIADGLRMLSRIVRGMDEDRAEALCREALELGRRGPDRMGVAQTLLDMGVLRAHRLDYEEAVKLYEESNALWKEQIGRDSSGILTRLSSALDRLGRHDEAVQAAERAIDLLRSLKGDRHPDTADAIVSLGCIHLNACAYEEAEKRFRECLAIRRAIFPSGHPAIAAALERVAEALGREGRKAEMVPLLEEALEARRRSSGGDASRCEALGLLGTAYAAIGRAEEGEKLARESVEIARGLGADNEQVARSLSYLRDVLGGGSEESIALSREIVEFWRAHLGEKSALTAVAWHNLACALHDRNNLDEAEAAYRKALAIWEGTDPDNPEASATFNNLGMLVAARGDLDSAEQMFRAALRIGMAARVPEDIALYHSQIGRVLMQRGKPAEAETEIRAAIETLVEHGRERSLTAIRLRETLAGILLPTRPAEAAEYLDAAWAGARDLLGPDDPGTVRLLAGRAMARRAAGQDASEAERLIRQALEATARESGETADETQIFRVQLALIIAERGGWAEAEALLGPALDRLRAGNPPAEMMDRPLETLVTCLTEQGKRAEAEPIARELLRLRRSSRGDGDSPTLAAWMLLGNMLLETRPQDAVKVFEEARAATGVALGKDHPATLDLGVWRARALHACGRTGDAEKALRDAIEAATRARGDDARDGGLYCLELGEMLAQEQRYAEAEAVLRKSLAALRVTAPADDPERIRALELTAIALSAQHKAEECESIATELLDARRAGEPDRLAVALALVGGARVRLGKYAEAEPLLAECLGIRQRILPADSWLIANTKSLLGACLEELGKHAEAERLLIEGYEKMIPPEQWAFRKREALDRIVALYEARGDAEKAALWRAKAAD